MMVEDLRDAATSVSMDEALTIMQAASAVLICLIPTIIVILVLHAIHRTKLNSKAKAEQQKKQKRQQAINELFNNEERMLSLIGTPDDRPSNKAVYKTLYLEFDTHGKIKNKILSDEHNEHSEQSIKQKREAARKLSKQIINNRKHRQGERTNQ